MAGRQSWQSRGKGMRMGIIAGSDAVRVLLVIYSCAQPNSDDKWTLVEAFPAIIMVHPLSGEPADCRWYSRAS